MYSINTLVINRIEVEQENSLYIHMWSAKLVVFVEFADYRSGDVFFKYKFNYKNNSQSVDDCVRKCIQDFLDHNYYSVDHEVYSRHDGCRRSPLIHHIDIQLGEPFESLFKDLFSKQNWSIQKELTQ